MKFHSIHLLSFFATCTSALAYPYDDSLDDLAETYTVTGNGGRTNGVVEDYNIPINGYPDTITFTTIRGGDGGDAKANADIGEDRSSDGGGGALISDFEFAVHPTNDNALRPGGEIRLILGNKGDDHTRGDSSAAGGGGGTGVLYRAPVDGADWELLALAGGGGGASVSAAAFDTYTKDGKDANTGTAGDDGGDDGFSPGGRSGGADGLAGTGFSDASGGGGGYLQSNGSDQGGKLGKSSGGNGGENGGGSSYGGFGCGGGGGGYADVATGYGGGGGGYSGGGAGGTDGQGGGAGSYLSTWGTGSISTRSGSGSNGTIVIDAPLVNGNTLPYPTISINGDAEHTVYFGESYTDLGASATDVYGVSLTIDIEIPSGLQNGVIGEYIVLYSATDQFDHNTSTLRRVSVTYERPTFDLIGNQTILQGSGAESVSNFAYNFDANDSGQSLDSYEVTNNDNDLFSVQPSIDNSGTLTFTAEDSATGSATVSVVAIDDPDEGDDGRSLKQQFTITVTAATKPTFDLSGDISIDQGEGAQSITNFTSNFNANDVGQSLDSYEVTNNDNSFFSVQPSIDSSGTLTFTAQDDSSGDVTVSVVAIDDANIGNNGRSVTQTFTLSVTAATRPTFDLAGNITIDEDAGSQSTSNFASNFNANDAGQSLISYQVTNDNSALFSSAPAIDNSGTLTFTPADDATGSATVSVVAIDNADIGDNGQSLTQTFTITVNPLADLPYDFQLGANQVDDGHSGRVGVVYAYDPLDGVLSFEIVGGADADLFTLERAIAFDDYGKSLEITTPLDFYAPTDADGKNDYEVTIAVTNAEGTVTETFIIYVNEIISTDPAYSLTQNLASWHTKDSGRYARIYTTYEDEQTGTAVTTWSNDFYSQDVPAYAGVQEINYDTDYVYVRTTGLAAGHVMGPWYIDITGTNEPFNNWPEAIETIYRIPAQPVIPETKTTYPVAAIGLMIDGTLIFSESDTYSWDNDEDGTGNGSDTDPGTMGTGDGLWLHDAYVTESSTFDRSNAHAAGNQLHYHASPTKLRHLLGDSVEAIAQGDGSYLYQENFNGKHSPILGWLADGIPLYGPYGYGDAMDPESDIRRMVSGFIVRDGQNGSYDTATNGRTRLPSWASRYRDRGSACTTDEQGPTTAILDVPYFMEDYDYLGDLTNPADDETYEQNVDFDLNEYNCRFCVTPEFPEGTWAYFVSIGADGNPAFPYNVGAQYYGDPSNGGNIPTLPALVEQSFIGGPDTVESNHSVTQEGDDVVITWNVAEGGNYTVLSSTTLDGWEDDLTDVTATYNTLTIDETPAASETSQFYRIERTGIAEYDDGSDDGDGGESVVTKDFTFATTPTMPNQNLISSTKVGPADATIVSYDTNTGIVNISFDSNDLPSGEYSARFTFIPQGGPQAGNTVTRTSTNLYTKP